VLFSHSNNSGEGDYFFFRSSQLFFCPPLLPLLLISYYPPLREIVDVLMITARPLPFGFRRTTPLCYAPEVPFWFQAKLIKEFLSPDAWVPLSSIFLSNIVFPPHVPIMFTLHTTTVLEGNQVLCLRFRFFLRGPGLFFPLGLHEKCLLACLLGFHHPLWIKNDSPFGVRRQEEVDGPGGFAPKWQGREGTD